jgi:hypothetical protein
VGAAAVNQTPFSQVNQVPSFVFKTGDVLLGAYSRDVPSMATVTGLSPSKVGAAPMRASCLETRKVSTPPEFAVAGSLALLAAGSTAAGADGFSGELVPASSMGASGAGAS